MIEADFLIAACSNPTAGEDIKVMLNFPQSEFALNALENKFFSLLSLSIRGSEGPLPPQGQTKTLKEIVDSHTHSEQLGLKENHGRCC